ncbi:hypothetical protein [Paenibacillus brevis]|uniref:Uncharacterized protein n=1 Tax=Paenibacillus brevis TaxID=2841508 RepID=A0ABS6FTW0_9BACL|nr:hypothetical protein [Paenibacillus brevis]MBU5673658.1 hypothetical protein [Paenibacillus brevis]
MGTSKKNINRDVKKLLQQLGKQDIKKSIPQATSLVLDEQRITKELNKDSFKVLLQQGITGINSMKSEGQFGGISYDEIQSNERIFNEFLEKLIELAEEEFKDEFSELLLQAFRLAITTILKENIDIDGFISEFTYYLIYLIVQTELIEVFSDVYLEIPHDEINLLIKIQARKIVSEELTSLIKGYLSSKISLKELITSVVKRAEAIEFGEF